MFFSSFNKKKVFSDKTSLFVREKVEFCYPK